MLMRKDTAKVMDVNQVVAESLVVAAGLLMEMGKGMVTETVMVMDQVREPEMLKVEAELEQV